MELLARAKVLVLAFATLGGCLLTGLAWFAILWVAGGTLGIGTTGFHTASAVVTILAVVAMLWFIWWLVMRFLPRLDRAVDRAAEGLVNAVGLGGAPVNAPPSDPAESDEGSGPTLVALDARFAPPPDASTGKPESRSDLSAR